MQPTTAESSATRTSARAASPAEPVSISLPSVVNLHYVTRGEPPSSPSEPATDKPYTLVEPADSHRALPIEAVHAASVTSKIIALEPPLGSSLVPETLDV